MRRIPKQNVTLTPKDVSDIFAYPPETEALEYGSGDGAVYAFYNHADRVLARKLGLDTWPCKVGMTRRGDGTSRVLQNTTAFPYTPVFALTLRTDQPLALERLMHRALSGHRVPGALGTEWFHTNIRTLVRIYKEVVDLVGSEPTSEPARQEVFQPEAPEPDLVKGIGDLLRLNPGYRPL
ncbi:MAG TPA: GIY-YIG nuclease family protein [Polyangiaceae bacterium]|nr:GIY-YIG nuclease family protein [Polyangiaceae bacterium]